MDAQVTISRKKESHSLEQSPYRRGMSVRLHRVAEQVIAPSLSSFKGERLNADGNRTDKSGEEVGTMTRGQWLQDQGGESHQTDSAHPGCCGRQN